MATGKLDDGSIIFSKFLLMTAMPLAIITTSCTFPFVCLSLQGHEFYHSGRGMKNCTYPLSSIHFIKVFVGTVSQCTSATGTWLLWKLENPVSHKNSNFFRGEWTKNSQGPASPRLPLQASNASSSLSIRMPSGRTFCMLFLIHYSV